MRADIAQNIRSAFDEKEFLSSKEVAFLLGHSKRRVLQAAETLELGEKIGNILVYRREEVQSIASRIGMAGRRLSTTDRARCAEATFQLAFDIPEELR